MENQRGFPRRKDFNWMHRFPLLPDIVHTEQNCCVWSLFTLSHTRQAALNYLYYEREDIDRNKIVVFGRSLGGAVGIKLTAENQDKVDYMPTITFLLSFSFFLSFYLIYLGGGGASALLLIDKPLLLQIQCIPYTQVAALIVENTFVSIPDMIDVVCIIRSQTIWLALKDIYIYISTTTTALVWFLIWSYDIQVLPWIRPFKFLSTNKWNSGEAIQKIAVPILFLSGARDELVPPRMMKALYDNAQLSLQKQFLLFETGYHMDTFMQRGYYKSVKEWLTKVLSPNKDKQEEEEEDHHHHHHHHEDEEEEEDVNETSHLHVEGNL